MARARNIKPGFFKNEELAELPIVARLLFAGLWTVADKEGRLEDRPRRIKAEVLPYDDADVDALLWSLHKAKFILRYHVGGQALIAIPAWHKHQVPHHREVPSALPPPPEEEDLHAEPAQNETDANDEPSMTEASLKQAPSISEASSNNVASCPTLTLNSDSLNPKPDSLNPSKPSVHLAVDERGLPIPPERGQSWDSEQASEVLRVIGWAGIKKATTEQTEYLEALEPRMFPNTCTLADVHSRLVWFQEFWDAYWRKVGKKEARIAYFSAAKDYETAEAITRSVDAQSAAMLKREEQFRPHASSWLNGEHWNDTPEKVTEDEGGSGSWQLQ